MQQKMFQYFQCFRSSPALRPSFGMIWPQLQLVVIRDEARSRAGPLGAEKKHVDLCMVYAILLK